MSEQIENPFLAAETAAEASPSRSAAGGRLNDGAPQRHAASPRRRLVIDEPPDRPPVGTRPGPVASIPGLERPRPFAGRLAWLRTGGWPARRVAIAGVCAAVLIVVLLAVSAMSGGGSDTRLLAARRTIASLSDGNRRLQAQALSFGASQRRLQSELQAARTQLQAAQARLAAAHARQHGQRKGG